MAFSSNCVDRIGYFDEKIFMYCEEVDYCLRASLNGYKMEVLPVVVFHKEGGSQGGGAGTSAWFQVLRNKYYVLGKHFGWGPWLLFFWTTLLLKSFLPIGESPGRKGARQVLLYLIFGVLKLLRKFQRKLRNLASRASISTYTTTL
jgi:GT2 family glycosyltransferase